MNDLTRDELAALPSHPSALDLSRAMRVTVTEVYDAFSSCGQHVGNVPRRTAVAIVRDFVLESMDGDLVGYFRRAGAL